MTKIEKVSYSAVDQLILRGRKGVKRSKRRTSPCPTCEIGTSLKGGRNVTKRKKK